MSELNGISCCHCGATVDGYVINNSRMFRVDYENSICLMCINKDCFNNNNWGWISEYSKFKYDQDVKASLLLSRFDPFIGNIKGILNSIIKFDGINKKNLVIKLKEYIKYHKYDDNKMRDIYFAITKCFNNMDELDCTYACELLLDNSLNINLEYAVVHSISEYFIVNNDHECPYKLMQYFKDILISYINHRSFNESFDKIIVSMVKTLFLVSFNYSIEIINYINTIDDLTIKIKKSIRHLILEELKPNDVRIGKINALYGKLN